MDRCYFSDEIGAVKPDREVFDHVLAELGTPPRRIAFFDDTAANVEAARCAGLTAFEVDGFGALKEVLHRLELLDP
jgi:putative hydrolase of the HAD superfamily